MGGEERIIGALDSLGPRTVLSKTLERVVWGSNFWLSEPLAPGLATPAFQELNVSKNLCVFSSLKAASSAVVASVDMLVVSRRLSVKVESERCCALSTARGWAYGGP